MPPKNKHTKEEIISAALSLAKEGGKDAVTARAVAARLGSSSKVIFGFFESMDALLKEVYAQSNRIYLEHRRKTVESGEYPLYKAGGMSYIGFAKDEPQLFKMLFMCDRRKDEQNEVSEELNSFANMISEMLGITKEEAFVFHLEMWVYVHGIASMIATGYLDWETDMISRMLSDAYLGLVERYKGKAANNSGDTGGKLDG